MQAPSAPQRSGPSWPGSEGSNGAIRLAQELSAADSSLFMPFQYGNAANPRAHEEGTGPEILAAAGATVDEVLADLFANYPALRDRVTADGELSPFVNVYVNDRDVRYRDGLETPVGPDDTVILLPAMAGGAR